MVKKKLNRGELLYLRCLWTRLLSSERASQLLPVSRLKQSIARNLFDRFEPVTLICSEGFFFSQWNTVSPIIIFLIFFFKKTRGFHVQLITSRARNYGPQYPHFLPRALCLHQWQCSLVILLLSIQLKDVLVTLCWILFVFHKVTFLVVSKLFPWKFKAD